MATGLNQSLPVVFGDRTHHVGIEKVKGVYNVSVDGIVQGAYKTDGASAWMFGEQADLPVQVEGQNLTVSIRKGVMRLVANGQYIDNGQLFEPARSMPAWIWAFVAVNALIPIISLGGWLNVLIALFGIILCGTAARSKISSTTGKVLACVGISVAAWVVWFLVQLLFLSIR